MKKHQAAATTFILGKATAAKNNDSIILILNY